MRKVLSEKKCKSIRETGLQAAKNVRIKNRMYNHWVISRRRETKERLKQKVTSAINARGIWNHSRQRSTTMVTWEEHRHSLTEGVHRSSQLLKELVIIKFQEVAKIIIYKKIKTISLSRYFWFFNSREKVIWDLYLLWTERKYSHRHIFWKRVLSSWDGLK